MVERRYWLSKTVKYVKAKAEMSTSANPLPQKVIDNPGSSIFEPVYHFMPSIIRVDSFIPRTDT